MTSETLGNWRLPAFITLCVFTAVGWLPFVAVLASGLFATIFSCIANEAGAHPCIVGGVDFGELIYYGVVSGWFMLVTWPVMLLTLLAWLALGVLAAIRRFTMTTEAPR